MIVRNGLYFPFFVALIIYLAFTLIIVLGVILNYDFGVKFLEYIIQVLINFGVIEESGTYTLDNVNFDKLFLYVVLVFGIVYDLITRIIRMFYKRFNHLQFQIGIVKTISYAYLVLTICLSLLVIFFIKDFSIIWLLLIVTVINIVLLLWSALVTVVFRIIFELIKPKSELVKIN